VKAKGRKKNVKWKTVALGGIFDIARGGSPRPIDKFITDDPEGVNWIMISDASSKYITSTKKRIIKEGMKKSREVHPGDFLLTNSMSFGRPYIMQTSGCIHDGWLVLSPRDGAAHPDYFYHLLGSDVLYAEFERRAAGATVKNLNIDLVKGVEVPLPPLEEQKRIAEMLDKAEELRAKRRAALAQLDTLTQSIFLEMFGDPALNPKKWSRLKLVDVCSSPEDIKCGPFGTQLSCSEFRKEGVPLWGIKNVNKHFELPTHEFLDASTAQRLIQYSIESGDIVMTRKGTVGNCSVYPSDFPLGIMHSDLLRLRVDREKCDPLFLSHQLHYSRAVAGQLALISGGAVMPGINVTKLKSLEVLIPGIVLQREFANRVSAVEKLKATQRASLAELDTLFASIQHRAFSGEL
jgi:type I restriction enzyme S subunit